tara:strand:+ start:1017 stop:1283 length:267 start_codon:yes stop_codon:yes gene_type:complete
MVFEIILTIIIVIQVYVIINLLVKTEKLETWVETFTQQVIKVQEDLNDIDQTGAFKSDDEVGSIFQQIKLIINELDKFRGEEVNASGN